MPTKQFGVDYDAASTPLDGTESLSIVQGGVTVDATTQDIADLATGFANPMTTAGDIIKGGASGVPERLAVGSSGNVLTVSGGAPAWAAPAAPAADSITNTMLANMAANTIKGNNTGGGADPLDLTATQTTAMLDTFTDALKGLAPASGGGTANYLRADGSWAAPPGTSGISDGDKGDITVSASGATWTIDSGAVTNAKLANVATATFKGRTTAGTGVPEDLTATQATALLNTFDSSNKGLAPASGGGTSNFLRADGTWAAPSGGSSSNPLAEKSIAFGFPNPAAATANLVGIGSISANASSPAAVTPTSGGTAFQALRRIEYNGTNTTSSAGGFYTTAAYLLNAQGYKFILRAAPSTLVSTSRFFMGVRSSLATFSDVEPSTLTNIIGLAFDAADTNMQIMHNDGSGTATKIDLGASFPVPTAANTDYYELQLECTAGGNVNYTAKKLSATTATATGTISTNMPASTQFLGFGAVHTAGGTLNNCLCFFLSVYIEQSF